MKKYDVEVTDENDVSRKYKVKISGFKLTKNKQYEYKPNIMGKMSFVLIVLTLIVTGFVIFLCCPKITDCATCEKEVVNPSDSITKIVEALETRECGAKQNIIIKYINNCTKKNFYLLLVFYIVAALGEIICLSMIIVKDDGGIRFAKLNALMSLQQKFEKTKDYESTEEELVKCKLCTKQKESDASSSCECNLPEKITKKKNLYGELTKTLINGITEI